MALVDFSYCRSKGLLWFPKGSQVGKPGWAAEVVKSPTCPDQRRFRRLTRAERLQFLSEKPS